MWLFGVFNQMFKETNDNPMMQGWVTVIDEIGCLSGAMCISRCSDNNSKEFPTFKLSILQSIWLL
jgi:Fe-S-cluster-containing dehydrogenase component